MTPASTKRMLGWALVAALTVAAVTASAAPLEGDFDDTELRVIATSLGFAVFSATAAAGATVRMRAAERLQDLGLVTVVTSSAAFLLLGAALWIDWDAEPLWRAWGCTGLAALASSHACVVSAARRSTDTGLIDAIASVSIATAVGDAFLLGLAVAGVVDDIDEGMAQFMGVLVIVLLLTSVLPPIMRRLEPAPASAQRVPSPPARETASAPRAERASAALAAEVLAAADRIQELNADAGNRAPEIRRECERLRQLARSYAG